MVNSLPQWVIDTSVLIDFHVGGIISSLFSLPVAFVSTDILTAELRSPPVERVLNLGLRPIGLTSEQVSALVALRLANPGISIADLSAYLLAYGSGLPLFTGDQALRLLAEKAGIEVHGTLWLLDALVERVLLRRQIAADALQTMRSNGRRLPDGGCERRLEVWRREA